jgi:hypothetical protein
MEGEEEVVLVEEEDGRVIGAPAPAGRARRAALFSEWRLHPNDSQFAIDTLDELGEGVFDFLDSQVKNKSIEHEESEFQTAIMSELEFILKSMETLGSNVGVQRYGCRLILLLSHSVEHRERLAAAGSIEQLVVSIRDHSMDDELQCNACLALAYLAQDHSERQSVIVAQGSVELVVTAMTLHPMDSNLQLGGCCVFAHLAKNNLRNQYLIGKADGVEAISAGLLRLADGSPRDDERDNDVECEAVHRGIEALQNLAQHEANKIKMAKAGAIPVLVGNLRGGRTSLRLQQSCCGALSHLATNTDNRAAIVAMGSIQSILAAMQTFLGDAELQVQGLNALGSLVRDSRKNVVLMAQLGGMKAIYQANLMHSSHAQVQAAVVDTLFLLTHASVEKFLESLSTPSDSTSAQERGPSASKDAPSESPRSHKRKDRDCTIINSS